MGSSKAPKAPKAPDYVGAANAQGEQNLEAARTGAKLSNPNVVGPNGSQSVQWNGDTPTVTQTLSPEQQQLYDKNNAARNRFADALSTNQPFSFNAPDSQYSVNQGQIQNSVDPSNDQTRNHVEDSLYNRSTSRMDPQFQRQEDQLRTRLTNQGLNQNDEAWKNDMTSFNNSRNDAYAGARNDAVQQGGAEQSRLLNNQLASGNFANQAQQQGYNQNLSSANLNNQERQNALAEALQLRQQPLQEQSQLFGLSQGQTPTFQGYSGTQVQPGNYAGAIDSLGNYNADLYNARAAQAGNTQSGLFGLAGSLGGAAIKQWSDRRLKTDIHQIGKFDNGFTKYSYRYIWDNVDVIRVGVMADEVEKHMPDAVIYENGYQKVDYGKVFP